MGNKIRTVAAVLKNTTRLFLENDPLRMAGATAFFTMFALPPILIILVQAFSLFINPKTIRHQLFLGLSDIFGREAVQQIISVIRAVRELSFNWPATILGFIFLLFVATTVFKVIRNSINQIWDVPKPAGKKVIITLQSRIQSLAVIFVTGMLFATGIFIEAVQVFIGNYFFRLFPSVSGIFSRLLAFIISTFIIAIWFLIILRYLNDKRPAWRTAWAGALFTSLLFSIGKIILNLLLNYNNINTIYGASASIVLLLLFIFYSAMILYYGAAFTKVWGQYKEQQKQV
jgi:membrane protein